MAKETESISIDQVCDEMLECARYGELDDLRTLVEQHGQEYLTIARTDSGNSLMHYAAANGHEGELLPLSLCCTRYGG